MIVKLIISTWYYRSTLNHISLYPLFLSFLFIIKIAYIYYTREYFWFCPYGVILFQQNYLCIVQISRLIPKPSYCVSLKYLQSFTLLRPLSPILSFLFRLPLSQSVKEPTSPTHAFTCVGPRDRRKLVHSVYYY